MARRSFNKVNVPSRYKSDGRGWHEDNWRHHEAKKYGRASDRVGEWSSVSAPTGFLDRYYPFLTGHKAERKHGEKLKAALDGERVEEKALDVAPSRFLNKWYPYLPEEVRGSKREVIESHEADETPEYEALEEKGAQLLMGAKEESEEHHLPFEGGVKVAEEHLEEDPEYYKKLKKAGLMNVTEQEALNFKEGPA